MWYSVCLLSESKKRGARSCLWEESIVLVEAMSQEEAELKAATIGKKRETHFQTISSEYSEWNFKCVESVFEILDEVIEEETEVFSRFLRQEEVASFLKPFD